MPQSEESQEKRPSILDGYPVEAPEELNEYITAVIEQARDEVGKLDFHSVLAYTPQIKTMIGQLMLSGARSSHTQKIMAEAKSLRQSDNPEQRTDLYSYQNTAETVEGQAGMMMGILLAFIEGKAGWHMK